MLEAMAVSAQLNPISMIDIHRPAKEGARANEISYAKLLKCIYRERKIILHLLQERKLTGGMAGTENYLYLYPYL